MKKKKKHTYMGDGREEGTIIECGVAVYFDNA